MRVRYGSILLFSSAYALVGCTLALDFDSLQTSKIAKDDEPTEEACVADADCADGIDCTVDVCGEDNVCDHNPDNSMCDGYDVCSPDEGGCVDSGRECVANSECDDGVGCTVDRCADGVCTSLTDDDWCDSNDPCWVASTCDPDLGCTGGAERVCPQPEEVSCYLWVCNSDTGECDTQVLKNGADSDNDGYCDDNPLFGGDDCQDGDEDINPGATDVCNWVDDNCDGVADGDSEYGPVDIPVGENAILPGVAFADDRFAVVWQEGTGETAESYVYMLGTGACVVESDCQEVEDLPAIGPMELGSLGGADASASAPAVAAYGGRFSVVWISEVAGETPRVMQVGFEPSADGASVTFDDAVVLSDDTAIDVSETAIDWKGSEGWTAAWIATLADDTFALQAATEGGMPFTGESSSEMRGLTLVCYNGVDCVAAFSRSANGDAEVFEARLDITGTTVDYRDGWPLMISLAATQVGDASRDPQIAWIGSDDWIVSFTDVALVDVNVGPEPETDIRAARNGEVQALVAEEDAQQYNAALAFDGNRFGMMYVMELGGVLTLDFRMMDADLTLYDQQRTRLGELDAGAFISSSITTTGEGFAFAWIVKVAFETNTFHFVHFDGCSPANR